MYHRHGPIPTTYLGKLQLFLIVYLWITQRIMVIYVSETRRGRLNILRMAHLDRPKRTQIDEGLIGRWMYCDWPLGISVVTLFLRGFLCDRYFECRFQEKVIGCITTRNSSPIGRGVCPRLLDPRRYEIQISLPAVLLLLLLLLCFFCVCFCACFCLSLPPPKH